MGQGTDRAEAVNYLRELWPASDREAVSDCPVYGRAKRDLLYEGTTNRVFEVADGARNLYQYDHCRDVYLGPRSSRDSIPRADATTTCTVTRVTHCWRTSLPNFGG